MIPSLPALVCAAQETVREPLLSVRFDDVGVDTALEQLFTAARKPWRLDGVTRKDLNGTVTIPPQRLRLSDAVKLVLEGARVPLVLKVEGEQYVIARSVPKPAVAVQKPKSPEPRNETATPGPLAAASPTLSLQIGHTLWIDRLHFSPDSQHLLTGGNDGTHVWDLRTRTVEAKLNGRSWDFLPDGDRIYAQDSQFVEYSLKEQRVVRQNPPTSGCIAFDPGRNLIASGLDNYIDLAGDGGRTALRQWLTPGDRQAVRVGSLGYHRFTFGAQGRRIVAFIVASGKHSIAIWDTDDGRLIATVPITPYAGFALDRRGATLLTEQDKTFSVYDVASGSLLKRLPRPANCRISGGSGAQSHRFTPDGRHLILLLPNGACLFSLETGSIVRVYETPGVRDAALAPDGQQVAVTDGMEVRLLDRESGRETGRLSAHPTRSVDALRFAPDKTLLVGQGSRTLRWPLVSPPQTLSSGSDRRLGSGAFLANGVWALWKERSRILDIAPSSDRSLTFSSGTLALQRRGSVVQTLPWTPRDALGAFHPSGPWALVWGESELILWDTSIPRVVRRWRPADIAARATRFLQVDWGVRGEQILILVESPEPLKSTVLDWAKQARHHLAVLDKASGRVLSRFDYASNTAGAGSLHRLTQDGEVFLNDWYFENGNERWGVFAWTPESGRLRTIPSEVFPAVSAISPDGTFFVQGDPGMGAVALWRWKPTVEKIRSWSAHDAVTQIVFRDDGAIFATSGQDGVTRLWRSDDGVEVAQLVTLASGDWIVATPEGYYTTSKGAAKAIGFRIDGQNFPFEQFDLKLNRPDIVLERLGYADLKTIAAYRRLYEKRLKQAGVTEDQLAPDFHTPLIRIDQKALPTTTRLPVATIALRALDERQKLQRIAVSVNGVPAQGVDLAGRGLGEWAGSVSVDLSPGRNRIQVWAVNDQQAASRKQTFEVFFDDKAFRPDLYVLAVGIDKYQDPKVPTLGFAVKDATDVAAALAAPNPRWRKVNRLVLPNDKASREGITKALESFAADARLGDTVIVYVAGHGIVADDYYFAAYDTQAADLKGTGVPFADLDGALAKLKARRRLLLLDTCQSGEPDREAQGRVAPSTPKVAGRRVVTRALEPLIADPNSALGFSRSLEWMRELFSNLERGSGATVIGASGWSERAMEDTGKGYRNGLFAYALLTGLKGRAADVSKDGVVSVSELRGWVERVVLAESGGQQRPTVRQENLDDDFPVF